jgi:beta-xylosidase
VLPDKADTLTVKLLRAGEVMRHQIRYQVSKIHANFTGAFVGLCCQDLSGNRQAADFRYFLYREL